mmetsp:Transcript_86521/g.231943  ORF Transcript_86521/g.231943 Transcript_86521/m.231943 type:complete len:573 (-) Transcript_86521:33-1751(-)
MPDQHGETLISGETLPVEVHVDPAKWSEGRLVGLSGDGLALVQFEWWGTHSYECDCVRKPPQLPPEVDWAPGPNDVVECLISDDRGPLSWVKGRIRSMRSHVFQIELESTRVNHTVMLERESLRPVSTEPSLVPTSIRQELLEVEVVLRDWVTTDDARGCLTQVQTKSGVLLISIEGKGDERFVRFVGGATEIARAKLLLDVHFKHQSHVQQFYVTREKRLKVIEQRKARVRDSVVEEFVIDESLVGMVIGRAGSNVTKVQDELGVDVEVMPIESSPGVRKVRILGLSREAVRAARSKLEFIRTSFTLHPDVAVFIDQFVGLRNLSKQAQLMEIWFNEKWDAIEMCGLDQNIKDAELMLNTHIQYADVCENIEKSEREIQAKIAKLEPYARRYKGKGKKGQAESSTDENWRSKQSSENGKPASRGNAWATSGRCDSEQKPAEDSARKGKGKSTAAGTPAEGSKRKGKGGSRGTQKDGADEPAAAVEEETGGGEEEVVAKDRPPRKSRKGGRKGGASNQEAEEEEDTEQKESGEGKSGGKKNPRAGPKWVPKTEAAPAEAAAASEVPNGEDAS